jgi:hypothetical protein
LRAILRQFAVGDMLFDRRALFGGFMVWERRFDPARRI